MAEPVAELLRRSLGHLADEVPDSYRLLVDRLGRVVLVVEVDGEAFSVRAGHGRVQVRRVAVRDGVTERPLGPSVVEVGASREAVLDVLDGAVALAGAVESGRVRVLGSIEDVVAAHDALLAYAHAAVRAPSVPGLIDALRAGSADAR